MTYTAAFFVGNEYLGKSDLVPMQLRHGELQAPESVAYFCNLCGEVWARRVVTREDGRTVRFFVYSMPCAKHPNEWRTQVNGSMWMIWDKTYNASLPEKALKRELMLTLDHFDAFAKDSG